MSLGPGSRVGPYELTALLGEGGMGRVYRARDTKLGRSVALKVLPDDLAADPDRIARFEREAKVLASLNHPHIAALYGMEVADGRPVLVMELVEGPTLAERIANASAGRETRSHQGLSFDDVIAIARQIADALEAAHEQGIIHRDLKPANIKVREDGTVKVLDFGLAKALQPTEADGVTPGRGSLAQLNQTDAATMSSPARLLAAHAGATGTGVILGTASYMYDLSADGTRAVVTETSEGRDLPSHVRLVVNFTDEILRRHRAAQ